MGYHDNDNERLPLSVVLLTILAGVLIPYVIIMLVFTA